VVEFGIIASAPLRLDSLCPLRFTPPLPDTDHPDGQIWPGAKIFKEGDNGDYSDGPSSEPSHHFAYDSDDNWIYIAFQTNLTDYAFAGALIYEEDYNGTDYYN
jgi:hypothetical protein